MTSSIKDGEPLADGTTYSLKGIPIRNIWLLLLYASDLFGKFEFARNLADTDPGVEDLPRLAAKILLFYVRERLLRGLRSGSNLRQKDLTRVRGRVDILRTASHDLLSRGRIACRFYEPTLNTPRNRLIRAALEKGAELVSMEARASDDTAAKCGQYAALLLRLGVTGQMPDRAELAREPDTINNREEGQAVAAARLLLDMAIPATRKGQRYFIQPEKNETRLRELFEGAVRGFYRVTLSDGWHVEKSNHRQNWPLEPFSCSEGLADILPGMELDIVMTQRNGPHKVIIDTKFATLLEKTNFGKQRLKNAHLYQLYAYLRTQEDKSEAARHATGILLYPALGGQNEIYSCGMQGHKIIFATVNLDASAREIQQTLSDIIEKHV